MELITIIISLFAISISLYTIYYHKVKLQAFEVKMKEYVEETMEDQRVVSLKAKVRANYTRTKPGSYTIKVFNAGPAVARNVNIQFNPRDYNDLVDLSHFPCQKLDPQDSKEIYMNVHNEMHDTIGIKLQWDDENEFNNEHMQVISL